MSDIKYIKTKYDEIIIFPATMSHDEFKGYNPVSAGFVSIFIGKEGVIKGKCYGSSFSLGIDSDMIEDTRLLNLKFFNPFIS